MLEITAIIVGPVVAVIISLFLTRWLQQRDFIRNQRVQLFRTLVALRTEPFNAERLRSLMLIDFVFRDDAAVRRKWADFFESLNNSSFNDENGTRLRMVKQNDMLAEMAKSLGYHKNIGYADFERMYYPQGVADNNALGREIIAEFLKALRGINTDRSESNSERTIVTLASPAVPEVKPKP